MTSLSSAAERISRAAGNVLARWVFRSSGNRVGSPRSIREKIDAQTFDASGTGACLDGAGRRTGADQRLRRGRRRALAAEVGQLDQEIEEEEFLRQRSQIPCRLSHRLHRN